jgi:glycosylphosphatidylinositol transamidase (GPIT) subunit GPI8
MNVTFFLILSAILVLFMGLTYYDNVYAEELKVLESQLNNNSITGVLQNPHNHTVGSIFVRAEFYDKEDGHLVGLRDFYDVAKDPLKPNEKSSFKIYEHAGETQEFPKTNFIVKAEGSDYTNMKETSIEELIGDINNLSSALESIPNVDVEVTVDENGTQEIAEKTITYENGTKKIINKTGTYKITSDENH